MAVALQIHVDCMSHKVDCMSHMGVSCAQSGVDVEELKKEFPYGNPEIKVGTTFGAFANAWSMG